MVLPRESCPGCLETHVSEEDTPHGCTWEWMEFVGSDNVDFKLDEYSSRIEMMTSYLTIDITASSTAALCPRHADKREQSVTLAIIRASLNVVPFYYCFMLSHALYYLK